VSLDGLEFGRETDDPRHLEEVRRIAEELGNVKTMLIAIKGRGRSVQKTAFFFPHNLNAQERRAYMGVAPKLLEEERRAIVEREEERITQEERIRTLRQEVMKREEEYDALAAYCLSLEERFEKVKSELGKMQGGKDVKGLLISLLSGASGSIGPIIEASPALGKEVPVVAAKSQQALNQGEAELRWAALGREAVQRLETPAYEALLLFIAGCSQSPGRAVRAIREGAARLKGKGGK
jgi:hypothetical protein